MGVTYIEGQVKGPSGKQESVKFLRTLNPMRMLLH